MTETDKDAEMSLEMVKDLAKLFGIPLNMSTDKIIAEIRKTVESLRER